MCVDIIVGDVKVCGISGGEKKCLFIVCEFIVSLLVIFVDEFIIGLDVF